MNSTPDPNKTKVAIDWIKKLANGINPIDGSVVSDDDIVNNVHISRCLFYVTELLEEIGKRKQSSTKQYEEDFNLTPEALSKINITQKSTISVFVKEINKVIPENMKPLPIPAIPKWLVKIGYLEVVPKVVQMVSIQRLFMTPTHKDLSWIIFSRNKHIPTIN